MFTFNIFLTGYDERENPTFYDSGGCAGPPTCPAVPSFPVTASIATAFTAYFPASSQSGDVGGWLFLNLNNGGSPAYSSARNYFFGTTTRGPRQSQAWVVTSMFAEGRYAVEMDAAAVGNGCSPAPALSRVGPIAP